MTLKDILEPRLKDLPKDELVLIITADDILGNNPGREVRNYLFHWGGLNDYSPFSTSGSEAHVYSNGPILRLISLNGIWGGIPLQIPTGRTNESEETHFCLYSKPIEAAYGKANILRVLAKYQLSYQHHFIEQL